MPGATTDLNAQADGTTPRSMAGAVIYIRVSTKAQTENLSLPTQLRACEEYCRCEGLDVLARFKDRTHLQLLAGNRDWE